MVHCKKLKFKKKKVVGRILCGKKDTLSGYTKERIIINDNSYFALVKKDGKVVDGIVLKILESDWQKLDEYETNAYMRKIVSLKSGQKAWVYLKK